MRKRKLKKTINVSNIKIIILEHINNNLKDYILLVLFFLTGIIFGVIFINNSDNSGKEQIINYINEIIILLKGEYQINSSSLLKSSILENLKFTIILWFAGSTVIGMPFIYGVICYRGFCIGYTASSVIGVLGIKKGIIFLITSMLIQNIIFIPCMLALGVSGLKLYRSIIKNKRKENIKLEIYRHTVFSAIMLIGLIISSIAETYISSNLFTYIINYL